MSLSKEDIAELASKLQIQPDVLTEAFTGETEIKLPDLGIPVSHFFTEDQKIQLEKNLDKAGYEKGKLAEREMSWKEFKKENEITLEDVNNFPDYFKHLKSTHTESTQAEIERIKEELGKEPNELLETFKTQLESEKEVSEKLKEQIRQAGITHENEKKAIENRFTQEKVDNLLIREVGSINFEVPDHIEKQGEEVVKQYLKAEQFKALTVLKATREIKLEDGKPVSYKNGEKEVDNVSDPLPLAEVINRWAKESFLNVKTEDRKGRGSGSSSNVQSGIKACKTREELESFIESKKIGKHSTEATSIRLEWQKQMNP